MANLYREQVLGEKPIEGIVRLDAIRPASNNAASPINRKPRKQSPSPATDDLKGTGFSPYEQIPPNLQKPKAVPIGTAFL